jgi:hemerythrin-like domain-containing protein
MADRGDSEIDGLIDEHRALMTILGNLQRATASAEPDVIELLDRLERSLAHHTEREEAGLFRILGDVDVGPRYVGLFEHDHDHLVDLIAAARRDRNNVKDLVKTFEAHINREENDMFPAAEQLLGPADWDAIEAAVANLR